jgi:hypothetical protein
VFKELLKKWLAEILTKFNQAGDGTELLTKAISGLNRGLYGYVKTIMQSVVMPVAYTILALFFMLELYKASQRVEGIGGGSSLGAEVIFKAMFKMALCKLAVDSSLLFMEAIYAVFQKITSGIETAITIEAGVDGAIDLNALNRHIDSLSLGGQIGMLIELVIVKFGVWIIMGLVKVICIARFIEIYMYVAISPIPIATFPSDEMSQIGKNFLKSFAAVCLQGTLIFLVLTFFPVLLSEQLIGDDVSAFNLLLYSLVLILAVFGANRYAKSMLNAV